MNLDRGNIYVGLFRNRNLLIMFVFCLVQFVNIRSLSWSVIFNCFMISTQSLAVWLKKIFLSEIFRREIFASVFKAVGQSKSYMNLIFLFHKFTLLLVCFLPFFPDYLIISLLFSYIAFYSTTFPFLLPIFLISLLFLSRCSC